MSEVIVITSGKGGVGKTTTTANVGTGLVKLGKKVILIDADTGLRNLDVVLNLEQEVVNTSVDVVEGRCELADAVIQDKRHENLYLLPTAQKSDKSAISPEEMKAIVEALKPEFDYVLIDCPAGIEQGFATAIAGADRAIVVATPEVSSVRDADRIIGLLETNEMPKIELIVNRIRMDMVARGDMLSSEDVVDVLAVNLIGIVPDDENIVISTNKGEPLVGDGSKAGLAYMNICKRITGEQVEFLDLEVKKSIFSRIGKLFHRK